MSKEEREKLLKHFGAQRVHCFADEGKMVSVFEIPLMRHCFHNRFCLTSQKHTAIAYFSDELSALAALRSLHQLNVLQSCLCVEFWRGDAK